MARHTPKVEWRQDGMYLTTSTQMRGDVVVTGIDPEFKLQGRASWAISRLFGGGDDVDQKLVGYRWSTCKGGRTLASGKARTLSEAKRDAEAAHLHHTKRKWF